MVLVVIDGLGDEIVWFVGDVVDVVEVFCLVLDGFVEVRMKIEVVVDVIEFFILVVGS